VYLSSFSQHGNGLVHSTTFRAYVFFTLYSHVGHFSLQLLLRSVDTVSFNRFILTLEMVSKSKPNAFIVTMAEQHTKALELDKPALGGISPLSSTLIPEPVG